MNPQNAPVKTPDKPTAAKPEIKPAATAAPAAAQPSNSRKADLAPKLRRKGDIMKSLQSGAQLVQTNEGLYRIANANGSENRVSKRRIDAMLAKGELRMVAHAKDGKRYQLAPPPAKPSTPATTSK